MKHLKVSCRALEDFTLGSWFQLQARKGAEKNDPLTQDGGTTGNLFNDKKFSHEWGDSPGLHLMLKLQFSNLAKSF
jgi:hypothetical protein